MPDNYLDRVGGEGSLAQVTKRSVDIGGGHVDVVMLADCNGALVTGGGMPVPTGRVAIPVRRGGTTPTNQWQLIADLTNAPAQIDFQNRSTMSQTLVLQIGGAAGGDGAGEVFTVPALGSYVLPGGAMLDAPLFVSAGVTAAAVPYACLTF